MEALIIILEIYLLLYVIYIVRLIAGFSKVSEVTLKSSQPSTFFSVIVPFRNEADNLPTLLDSIKTLDYPIDLFEFILVDDSSSDDSQTLIYRWRMENGSYNLTLLENVKISGSPKKDAILRASMIATGDWIITTDADCKLPPTWLRAFNDYIATNEVEMIAGPVTYSAKYNFLEQFQRADFLSLQGATIGSFGIGQAFMCNGANLAYKKELFNRLDGFKGNDLKATGDDVFLLQKAVAEDASQVHYLKSKAAIVTTKPENSWTNLFNQRVRWASKTNSYQSEFGENLALLVLGGNLAFIILVSLFFGGHLSGIHVVGVVVVKLAVDWILMYKSNSFLYSGKFFFPIGSSIVYPLFSVGVAMYSMVFRYEWKGRSYR